MKINKAKKETVVLEKIVEKPEIKEKSPYMSKGIYNNYMKGMKERNQKRQEQGLKAIHIRSFEEWSAG